MGKMVNAIAVNGPLNGSNVCISEDGWYDLVRPSDIPGRMKIVEWRYVPLKLREGVWVACCRVMGEYVLDHSCDGGVSVRRFVVGEAEQAKQPVVAHASWRAFTEEPLRSGSSGEQIGGEREDALPDFPARALVSLRQRRTEGQTEAEE